MANVMTKRARAAFEWAAEHAIPGTTWELDGPPNSHSIVYFRVTGYESIGDPHEGCTLQIGDFKMRDGAGRLKTCLSLADLPAWFQHAQNGQATHMTAVRLKELVDLGVLNESAVRL